MYVSTPRPPLARAERVVRLFADLRFGETGPRAVRAAHPARLLDAFRIRLHRR
jgi:hypothetical protein